MKWQVEADLSKKTFRHFNNLNKGIESWCLNFQDLDWNRSLINFRNEREMNLFIAEYKKEFPNLYIKTCNN